METEFPEITEGKDPAEAGRTETGENGQDSPEGRTPETGNDGQENPEVPMPETGNDGQGNPEVPVPGKEEGAEGSGKESPDETEGNREEGSAPECRADIVRMLGGIKESLDAMSESGEFSKESSEYFKGALEAYETNRNAYQEEILGFLAEFSRYMDGGTWAYGIMPYADGDYTSVPLKDYYDEGLGFVVLPSREALDYYFSEDYVFVHWTGSQAIASSDNYTMNHMYGYQVSVSKDDWAVAGDGSVVEAAYLQQYEEYLEASNPYPDPDPEPVEGEGNTAAELLIPHLEAISTSLEGITALDEAYCQAASGYHEEMLHLQTAETASTIILCVVMFTVLAEMTFMELFRRFK